MKPSANGTATAQDAEAVSAPPPDQSEEETLDQRYDAAVAAAAARLEPDWLLERMRANCSMCGFSVTRVDDAPFQVVAREVYDELVRSTAIAAERAELDRLLAVATAAAVAVGVRTELKQPALQPLPDGFNRKALETRAASLRELAASSHAGVIGPVGLHVKALLGAIESVLDAAVRKAPAEVPALVNRATNALTACAVPAPADEAVAAFATLVGRFHEYEAHHDQIAERARKKVQTRFAVELRQAAAGAAAAVVEGMCAAELVRQCKGATARLARFVRDAKDRARLQEEVAARLGGAAGPTRGWAVALPTQAAAAVRQSVLAARGARDLADLASSYRDALGDVAPASRAEAAALAVRLVELVRADAGAESDFALIGTEEAARRLAGELYRRAHPHGAIRFADSRLRCDVYELINLELPVCPPGLEAVQAALLAELVRVSGKQVGVSVRPPGVPGLKLYREIGGVYTVNLQVLKFLRAGYEFVQELMPHDPHPVWSALVKLRGCLDLDRTAGEEK